MITMLGTQNTGFVIVRQNPGWKLQGSSTCITIDGTAAASVIQYTESPCTQRHTHTQTHADTRMMDARHHTYPPIRQFTHIHTNTHTRARARGT